MDTSDLMCVSLSTELQEAVTQPEMLRDESERMVETVEIKQTSKPKKLKKKKQIEEEEVIENVKEDEKPKREIKFIGEDQLNTIETRNNTEDGPTKVEQTEIVEKDLVEEDKIIEDSEVLEKSKTIVKTKKNLRNKESKKRKETVEEVTEEVINQEVIPEKKESNKIEKDDVEESLEVQKRVTVKHLDGKKHKKTKKVTTEETTLEISSDEEVDIKPVEESEQIREIPSEDLLICNANVTEEKLHRPSISETLSFVGPMGEIKESKSVIEEDTTQYDTYSPMQCMDSNVGRATSNIIPNKAIEIYSMITSEKEGIVKDTREVVAEFKESDVVLVQDSLQVEYPDIHEKEEDFNEKEPVKSKGKPGSEPNRPVALSSNISTLESTDDLKLPILEDGKVASAMLTGQQVAQVTEQTIQENESAFFVPDRALSNAKPSMEENIPLTVSEVKPEFKEEECRPEFIPDSKIIEGTAVIVPLHVPTVGHTTISEREEMSIDDEKQRCIAKPSVEEQYAMQVVQPTVSDKETKYDITHPNEQYAKRLIDQIHPLTVSEVEVGAKESKVDALEMPISHSLESTTVLAPMHAPEVTCTQSTEESFTTTHEKILESTAHPSFQEQTTVLIESVDTIEKESDFKTKKTPESKAYVKIDEIEPLNVYEVQSHLKEQAYERKELKTESLTSTETVISPMRLPVIDSAETHEKEFTTIHEAPIEGTANLTLMEQMVAETGQPLVQETGEKFTETIPDTHNLKVTVEISPKFLPRVEKAETVEKEDEKTIEIPEKKSATISITSQIAPQVSESFKHDKEENLIIEFNPEGKAKPAIPELHSFSVTEVTSNLKEGILEIEKLPDIQSSSETTFMQPRFLPNVSETQIEEHESEANVVTLDSQSAKVLIDAHNVIQVSETTVVDKENEIKPNVVPQEQTLKQEPTGSPMYLPSVSETVLSEHENVRPDDSVPTGKAKISVNEQSVVQITETTAENKEESLQIETPLSQTLQEDTIITPRHLPSISETHISEHETSCTVEKPREETAKLKLTEQTAAETIQTVVGDKEGKFEPGEIPGTQKPKEDVELIPRYLPNVSQAVLTEHENKFETEKQLEKTATLSLNEQSATQTLQPIVIDKEAKLEDTPMPASQTIKEGIEISPKFVPNISEQMLSEHEKDRLFDQPSEHSATISLSEQTYTVISQSVPAEKEGILAVSEKPTPHVLDESTVINPRYLPNISETQPTEYESECNIAMPKTEKAALSVKEQTVAEASHQVLFDNAEEFQSEKILDKTIFSTPCDLQPRHTANVIETLLSEITGVEKYETPSPEAAKVSFNDQSAAEVLETDIRDKEGIFSEQNVPQSQTITENTVILPRFLPNVSETQIEEHESEANVVTLDSQSAKVLIDAHNVIQVSETTVVDKENELKPNVVPQEQTLKQKPTVSPMYLPSISETVLSEHENVRPDDSVPTGKAKISVNEQSVVQITEITAENKEETLQIETPLSQTLQKDTIITPRHLPNISETHISEHETSCTVEKPMEETAKLKLTEQTAAETIQTVVGDKEGKFEPGEIPGTQKLKEDVELIPRYLPNVSQAVLTEHENKFETEKQLEKTATLSLNEQSATQTLQPIVIDKEAKLEDALMPASQTIKEGIEISPKFVPNISEQMLSEHEKDRLFDQPSEHSATVSLPEQTYTVISQSIPAEKEGILALSEKPTPHVLDESTVINPRYLPNISETQPTEYESECNIAMPKTEKAALSVKEQTVAEASHQVLIDNAEEFQSEKILDKTIFSTPCDLQPRHTANVTETLLSEITGVEKYEIPLPESAKVSFNDQSAAEVLETDIRDKEGIFSEQNVPQSETITENTVILPRFLPNVSQTFLTEHEEETELDNPKLGVARVSLDGQTVIQISQNVPIDKEKEFSESIASYSQIVPETVFSPRHIASSTLTETSEHEGSATFNEPEQGAAKMTLNEQHAAQVIEPVIRDKEEDFNAQIDSTKIAIEHFGELKPLSVSIVQTVEKNETFSQKPEIPKEAESEVNLAPLILPDVTQMQVNESTAIITLEKGKESHAKSVLTETIPLTVSEVVVQDAHEVTTENLPHSESAEAKPVIVPRHIANVSKVELTDSEYKTIYSTPESSFANINVKPQETISISSVTIEESLETPTYNKPTTNIAKSISPTQEHLSISEAQIHETHGTVHIQKPDSDRIIPTLQTEEPIIVSQIPDVELSGLVKMMQPSEEFAQPVLNTSESIQILEVSVEEPKSTSKEEVSVKLEKAEPSLDTSESVVIEEVRTENRADMFVDSPSQPEMITESVSPKDSLQIEEIATEIVPSELQHERICDIATVSFTEELQLADQEEVLVLKGPKKEKVKKIEVIEEEQEEDIPKPQSPLKVIEELPKPKEPETIITAEEPQKSEVTEEILKPEEPEKVTSEEATSVTIKKKVKKSKVKEKIEEQKVIEELPKPKEPEKITALEEPQKPEVTEEILKPEEPEKVTNEEAASITIKKKVKKPKVIEEIEELKVIEETHKTTEAEEIVTLEEPQKPEVIEEIMKTEEPEKITSEEATSVTIKEKVRKSEVKEETKEQKVIEETSRPKALEEIVTLEEPQKPEVIEEILIPEEPEKVTSEEATRVTIKKKVKKSKVKEEIEEQKVIEELPKSKEPEETVTIEEPLVPEITKEIPKPEEPEKITSEETTSVTIKKKVKRPKVKEVTEEQKVIDETPKPKESEEILTLKEPQKPEVIEELPKPEEPDKVTSEDTSVTIKKKVKKPKLKEETEEEKVIEELPKPKEHKEIRTPEEPLEPEITKIIPTAEEPEKVTSEETTSVTIKKKVKKPKVKEETEEQKVIEEAPKPKEAEKIVTPEEPLEPEITKEIPKPDEPEKLTSEETTSVTIKKKVKKSKVKEEIEEQKVIEELPKSKEPEDILSTEEPLKSEVSEKILKSEEPEKVTSEEATSVTIKKKVKKSKVKEEIQEQKVIEELPKSKEPEDVISTEEPQKSEVTEEILKPEEPKKVTSEEATSVTIKKKVRKSKVKEEIEEQMVIEELPTLKEPEETVTIEEPQEPEVTEEILKPQEPEKVTSEDATSVTIKKKVKKPKVKEEIDEQKVIEDLPKPKEPEEIVTPDKSQKPEVTKEILKPEEPEKVTNEEATTVTIKKKDKKTEVKEEIEEQKVIEDLPKPKEPEEIVTLEEPQEPEVNEEILKPEEPEEVTNEEATTVTIKKKVKKLKVKEEAEEQKVIEELPESKEPEDIISTEEPQKSEVTEEILKPEEPEKVTSEEATSVTIKKKVKKSKVKEEIEEQKVIEELPTSKEPEETVTIEEPLEPEITKEIPKPEEPEKITSEETTSVTIKKKVKKPKVKEETEEQKVIEETPKPKEPVKIVTPEEPLEPEITKEIPKPDEPEKLTSEETTSVTIKKKVKKTKVKEEIEEQKVIEDLSKPKEPEEIVTLEELQEPEFTKEIPKSEEPEKVTSEETTSVTIKKKVKKPKVKEEIVEQKVIEELPKPKEPEEIVTLKELQEHEITKEILKPEESEKTQSVVETKELETTFEIMKPEKIEDELISKETKVIPEKVQPDEINVEEVIEESASQVADKPKETDSVTIPKRPKKNKPTIPEEEIKAEIELPVAPKSSEMTEEVTIKRKKSKPVIENEDFTEANITTQLLEEVPTTTEETKTEVTIKRKKKKVRPDAVEEESQSISISMQKPDQPQVSEILPETDKPLEKLPEEKEVEPLKEEEQSHEEVQVRMKKKKEKPKTLSSDEAEAELTIKPEQPEEISKLEETTEAVTIKRKTKKKKPSIVEEENQEFTIKKQPSTEDSDVSVKLPQKTKKETKNIEETVDIEIKKPKEYTSEELVEDVNIKMRKISKPYQVGEDGAESSVVIQQEPTEGETIVLETDEIIKKKLTIEPEPSDEKEPEISETISIKRKPKKKKSIVNEEEESSITLSKPREPENPEEHIEETIVLKKKRKSIDKKHQEMSENVDIQMKQATDFTKEEMTEEVNIKMKKKPTKKYSIGEASAESSVIVKEDEPIEDLINQHEESIIIKKKLSQEESLADDDETSQKEEMKSPLPEDAPETVKFGLKKKKKQPSKYETDDTEAEFTLRKEPEFTDIEDDFVNVSLPRRGSPTSSDSDKTVEAEEVDGEFVLVRRPKQVTKKTSEEDVSADFRIPYPPSNPPTLQQGMRRFLFKIFFYFFLGSSTSFSFRYSFFFHFEIYFR